MGLTINSEINKSVVTESWFLGQAESHKLKFFIILPPENPRFENCKRAQKREKEVLNSKKHRNTNNRKNKANVIKVAEGFEATGIITAALSWLMTVNHQILPG